MVSQTVENYLFEMQHIIHFERLWIGVSSNRTCGK